MASAQTALHFRQFDGECCAAIRAVTADEYSTATSFNQSLGDGKPKAEPAGLGVLVATLLEGVEHFRQKSGLNTYPGIANYNPQAILR